MNPVFGMRVRTVLSFDKEVIARREAYKLALLLICLFVVCVSQNSVAQYCIPEYESSCSTIAAINKFTFNTLNNSNSGCNGNLNNYILYPVTGNTTTTVTLGGVYSLSVKSINNDGVGVWIDYNNDEDFDDAGEFVYSSPFYDNILFSGSVIIPNNPSYVGQRRMRVRGGLETLIYENNSCGSLMNGETEDYVITINPPPPCDGTPVAGTITAFPSSICAEGNTSELHLSGYSIASSIVLAWDSSADGNIWTTINGISGDSYTTSPLFNTTYYRAKITCSNSGQVAYSNEMKITIGEVKILSVTNDSLCGGGVANLQVTANAANILWYENETGGVPVYVSGSPSVFTPPVTESTTYYALASSGLLYIDSVGLIDSASGGGSDAYQNDYLVFSVLHSCKLIGVHVYPASEGVVILELRDKNFNPIITDTFVISASDVNQKTFLLLNYNLFEGTGFQLTLKEGSVPLWSNQSGVNFPYEIPNVISVYTSNLGPNYYFYFYNWIINYTEQCETPRQPVTVTVSNPPPLTISTTPSNATICSNAGLQVELNAISGYTSYTWSPASGLSSSTGAEVIATPNVTTTYTIVASDSICQNEVTVTVTIANTPNVTVTAASDSICVGTSVQLFATATPLLNYNVYEIPFNPDALSGTQVLLDEDEVSTALPIGFSFKFYGIFYNTFKIASNGFITFDALANEGCCAGHELPDILQPNNLIAFAWEDLSPQLGGNISYYVTGNAPYRKLVVRFDNVPHYDLSGSSDPIISQVILYETTNYIEVHTTSMQGNPSALWFPHTMGIENASGTMGASVPGRNGNNTWTATEDAWRFSPIEYTYSWSPASSLNDSTFSNPVAAPPATTIYSVTVSDTMSKCSSSGSLKINLVDTPSAGSIAPDFATFCETGFDTLTLNGFTSGASIQWQQSSISGGSYSDIAGATEVSFVTPLLNAATYYVATVSCTETSVTEEAILQVLPVPSAPSGESVYRCGPGKIDLQATGTGGSISWYDAETGGNYLGEGSPFTTQPISQSAVFWAEEGPPVASPLPTTFIGGNLGDGNMFDVTAIVTVVINGFEGHMAAGQSDDIEIYFRKGTYAGNENNNDAWSLLGAATGVAGQGVGIPTPFPIAANLTIPAGYTYSFYITSKSGNVNFTYGTLSGNVFASDDNLEIAEGLALDYPFGVKTEPVQWNGIIHYTTVGCLSERSPINAIVYYPQISVTTTNPSVCAGDTITLTAASNGFGSYLYQWMPLLPSMNPANGIGEMISVVPSSTVTLTLTATEISNTCDTSIMVPVTVYPLPVTAFAGLPDTISITDNPVSLTGNPAGGIFSGPGISGNVFDPSVAGIGGPYPITYSFTDLNGCFDDTVEYIVVVLEIGIPDPVHHSVVSIFPNPTAGQFTMQVQLPFVPGQYVINIRDLYGRVLYEKIGNEVNSVFNQSFDFGDWAKGVYLVEVKADGLVFSKRVTIQ